MSILWCFIYYFICSSVIVLIIVRIIRSNVVVDVFVTVGFLRVKFVFFLVYRILIVFFRDSFVFFSFLVEFCLGEVGMVVCFFYRR